MTVWSLSTAEREVTPHWLLPVIHRKAELKAIRREELELLADMKVEVYPSFWDVMYERDPVIYDAYAWWRR